MSSLKYLRASAVQQSPIWIAAVLAFAMLDIAYGGTLELQSAKGILVALVMGIAIVTYALMGQSMYAQGWLSRFVWLFVSAAPVWMVWDFYPFYAEAAPHDIFMKHAGKLAQYSPNENTAWSVVALGTYYVLALVLVANLAWALYISVGRAIWEIRNGVDGSTSEDHATPHMIDVIRSESRPRPAPQTGQPVLATRDTEALKPKLTFDELAGQEELKTKLFDAAQTWNNNGKKDGKNGIFLYGEPGTGKTAFAEALAGEVKMKIMKVNIGSMASRWINQTTEQLQDIIDSALRQAPCVLFLDEVEAIFPDRNRIERGDSEESKVVGSFLSSVEKLRAGRVLLVAATNYKDRVDAAAIREGRFDFHIEVTVPDFEARKGLTLNALKKTGKTVDSDVLERLARRWAGFNVPRIQEATRRAAGFAKTNVVGMADFMRGLRDVQGNASSVPETALGLSDLYFDDDLKGRLETLALTFEKSDEIEAKGATVPKGVIFYGPPGTGKTTMAQALAKASGWSFIATSGKDILSDAKRLEQIRRKASDLRPAIVFIDEADDILGDRRMSGMKLHTNELLATIDGAGEPLHDVVWVLATNDVDSLDDAVIRRFPMKIELPVPGLAALTNMVRDWATKHADKIAGEVEAWSKDVAAALEGLAPSVVKNILDSALNTEAANSVLRGEPMSITLEEVLEARREMRA